MRSLSNVGLGLGIVLGCLFLALVAELYYLWWWKKRITNREIEDDYSSPARELLYRFCWKKPPSLSSTALNPQELSSSARIVDTPVHEPQADQVHSNKDLWANPFGEDTLDSELMRLHNLQGPPRFLFTIKEETKEDLESEDGKSRGDRSRKGSRSKSLSDLILTVDTPYLTPLASPPYFTPPLTPMNSSYNKQGFNSLFESPIKAEFRKIKSSPPPKFKFLRDAENKLQRRRLLEEAETTDHNGDGSAQDEGNESFITLIVGKNKEKEVNHHQFLTQYPSSSSQGMVIPHFHLGDV
ncbi:unnamed protein product [Ilex paraguariensis]|uniref:Uncharacterized protein n=1 Tax=Ilex paraguariensis TaxID=185542 RepID=A0ABC8UKF3_9AQUA